MFLQESNRKAIPEKIRKVQRHSMECSFGGSLILVSCKNKGLCSSLKFACFKLMCTKTITLATVENATQVKRNVVQGCISTGVGYYQAEELFSVLDIPFMANGTYQKYEKSVGEKMKRLE
ncbi:hypothetical protein FQR65_LT12736 [Abscondita terminalis]|nr:hypothetical protein FQR65_LT12736 [Abscondita terminalis]